MWYTPAGERLPCASAVGSPNYGVRSVERDLEAQARGAHIEQNDNEYVMPPGNAETRRRMRSREGSERGGGGLGGCFSYQAPCSRHSNLCQTGA